MTANLLLFIIDDDQDDQDFFAMAIEEITPTITCVFADNGVEAIVKFNSELSFIPNFIFLDINMPKMNGMECLKKIKEIRHISTIPVYMYSTSDDPSIVQQCYLLGANGFIRKPTNIEDLKKRIYEAITLNNNLLL